MNVHDPFHKKTGPAGKSIEPDISDYRSLHAAHKVPGEKRTTHAADNAEKPGLLTKKSEIGDAGKVGMNGRNGSPYSHMAENIIFLHAPCQKAGAFIYAVDFHD